MTFDDWVQLAIRSGIAIILLAVFILIGAGGSLGRGNNANIFGNILTLLFDRDLHRGLLQDLHDPKIVVGGLLGLIIKMFKLGVILILIGGVLWGVSLI